MSANVQTIQNLYTAFGRGDIPTVLSLVSENIDWQFFGPPEVPFAGHYQGRAELANFFTCVGESIQSIEAFEPREFLDRGDLVVVFGYERVSAKKTGRFWECNFVHLWQFEGNELVRLREFYDTAPMVDAFLGR